MKISSTLPVYTLCNSNNYQCMDDLVSKHPQEFFVDLRKIDCKQFNMKVIILTLLVLGTWSTLFSQKNKKKDYLITISTEYGEILLILYDDTPKHKENFVKLVDSKYYDSTAFHRVIKNFMIQGGDPNSKPGGDISMIGRGGPGYTLDAEILPDSKHRKGSLAAARLSDQVNPEKASSGSQFYIVQNETGTPHLDGKYTIFGEVIQGIEVVDTIANQPVNRQNKPENDIYVIVKAKKMRRKKIQKKYGYEYKQSQS